MISFLHFKTRNRIDWKKTRENIRKRVQEEYIGHTPHAMESVYVSILFDLTRFVRKHGVRNIYDTNLRLLKERANQKEDIEEEQNKMYYMIGGIEPGQKGAENESE